MCSCALHQHDSFAGYKEINRVLLGKLQGMHFNGEIMASMHLSGDTACTTAHTGPLRLTAEANTLHKHMYAMQMAGVQHAHKTAPT